jgi:hypothetical protein
LTARLKLTVDDVSVSLSHTRGSVRQHVDATRPTHIPNLSING